MIAIKTILYPTDFSEYAEHAEAYAVELARKFGAEVLIVHVVPILTYPIDYAVTLNMDTMDQEVRKKGRERLKAYREEIAAQGVNADSEFCIGDPFTKIVEVAKRREVDLIVMATHGYGPVKHLLLGSTAERVVCNAPCPVLTIRHPEHEFVQP